MKFISLLLLIYISFSTAFAQEKYLELFNSDKNKIIRIEEGKRVRVKTLEGKKYSGSLCFTDSLHLSIDGSVILVNDLIKIKHNPIVLEKAIKIFLNWNTVGTVIMGLVISAYISSYFPILVAVPVAVLLAYSTSKSPNFIPSYKKARGWKYSIR